MILIGRVTSIAASYSDVFLGGAMDSNKVSDSAFQFLFAKQCNFCERRRQNK